MKKAIVFTDVHIPYEDSMSMLSLEKYIKDNKWDYWLCLGDLMDFDYLSSFNKDAPRLVEGKRITQDYIHANKFLDRHVKLVRKKNPKAEMVLFEGNHDERMERHINRNPSLEGLAEVETNLELRERNIKWFKYDENKLYKIGKAHFHHGVYTNKYHSFKHVDNFNVNLFYGHVHDIQSFSKITWGQHNPVVAQSIGCMCDYQQAYIRGRPTNWEQAFAVFHFYPNGNFNYYITRIINHSFISPEGKAYNPF